jgi:branched-subunit amino acid aminotransferase/4-amino-4-deoxychorismate lyase
MTTLPTPFAILNGELLPASQAGFPAHHQSLVDSFGIYETVLVQNGRFFHLDQHMNRLGQSAEILALDLPAPLEEIGAWVRRLAATMQTDCGLLRIVAYGGDGVHGPVCGLYVKPCPQHKPAMHQEGVAVVASEGERFRPLAKSNNCLAQALARFKAQAAGAHEGLIVDRHGHVTEGSTSNVLAVCGGALLRPLPGTALEGVTEAVTLQLAGELGIPVQFVPLPLAEVSTWGEAFLTSTNRRIMPIRRIDDLVLPASPGPITGRLMAAFRAYEAAQGWEA